MNRERGPAFVNLATRMRPTGCERDSRVITEIDDKFTSPITPTREDRNGLPKNSCPSAPRATIDSTPIRSLSCGANAPKRKKPRSKSEL
ncbi:hypothetical protein CGZ80_10605 [Rhodopirellula sp. MGV]|nr:hypothetical protein CGZ80_10605 [Rhodopirellula sp. MGV]PNY36351.1 hypothetical protein C2E31_13005 [Rhodopirellula baltica]